MASVSEEKVGSMTKANLSGCALMYFVVEKLTHTAA